MSGRDAMDHGVRLQDGRVFTVKAGETLLEAALRCGLRVPHNCRVGACATCRCKVVSGRARSLVDRAYVLPQEELGNAVFLACQTLPLSDLVVDWTLQPGEPQLAPGDDSES